MLCTIELIQTPLSSAAFEQRRLKAYGSANFNSTAAKQRCGPCLAQPPCRERRGAVFDRAIHSPSNFSARFVSEQQQPLTKTSSRQRQLQKSDRQARRLLRARATCSASGSSESKVVPPSNPKRSRGGTRTPGRRGTFRLHQSVGFPARKTKPKTTLQLKVVLAQQTSCPTILVRTMCVDPRTCHEVSCCPRNPHHECHQTGYYVEAERRWIIEQRMRNPLRL